MASKKAKTKKAKPASKPAKAVKPAKAKSPVVAKPVKKVAALPPVAKPSKVEPKIEPKIEPKVEAKAVKAAKPAKAPKVPPSLMAKKSAPEKKSRSEGGPEIPGSLSEEAMKLYKQWNSLREQHKNDRAPLYNLAADFPVKSPLDHKVLGWGYVLKKQNNRIEVLFREGVKVLVTNYKP